MAQQFGMLAAEFTGPHKTLLDPNGSGLELRKMFAGLGGGYVVTVAPGVVTKARLLERVDLQICIGVLMFVRDVGVGGSFWRSTGAGWAPDGPIRCTGTPEAQITAPIGSLALRTDGGAATTLYVKESGAGNTGWVAK